MPEQQAAGQGESLIHVAIDAEPLFAIGPLEFTNSMVGALMASVILLATAWWFARNHRLVPNRAQSLIELPVEWMAGIVAGAGGSRWRQFVPLIIGIFLFVLTANWIGLLPGVGTIEYHHVPIIRPASADLNFTLGLALISFVTFIAFAIRANGVGGYLKELLIADPKYMSPLMAPIHIISELSRLISLSMRLFGNVFAGEVLLATMLALVGLIIPVAFLGLEIVFGFVQALVFALLTMTYIILGIAEHHEGGGHAATPQDAEHDEGLSIPSEQASVDPARGSA